MESVAVEVGLRLQILRIMAGDAHVEGNPHRGVPVEPTLPAFRIGLCLPSGRPYFADRSGRPSRFTSPAVVVDGRDAAVDIRVVSPDIGRTACKVKTRC